MQYSRSRFCFKNGNRNSRTIVTTVYVAAWEGRRVRSWTKEARMKTLASILGLAAGLTAFPALAGSGFLDSWQDLA